MLSPGLLDVLRDYWLEARPEGWLFPIVWQVMFTSPRRGKPKIIAFRLYIESSWTENPVQALARGRELRFNIKSKRFNPLSPRQLNRAFTSTKHMARAFTSTKHMAGINKPSTLHTLRHSFATGPLLGKMIG